MHSSKKHNGRNGYNTNLSPAVAPASASASAAIIGDDGNHSSHDSSDPPQHTYARQDDKQLRSEEQEEETEIQLTGHGRSVIPLPLQTPSTYQALLSTLSSLGPIASGSSKTVGQWGKSAYTHFTNKRRMSEGGNVFSFGSKGSSPSGLKGSTALPLPSALAEANGDGKHSSGVDRQKTSLNEEIQDNEYDNDDDDDDENESEQAREANEQLAASIHHRPSSADDPVIWSSWDTLSAAIVTSQQTRVLVQIFASGRLKIWEAISFAELNEVLNIKGSSLSKPAQPAVPICARFLPCIPPPLLAAHGSSGSGHVLAILLNDSTVCLYSTGSHKVIRQLRLSQGRAVDFQVNNRFLVVSAVEPLSLHIYTLATLEPAPFSPLLDIAQHPYDLVPVYCLSASRLFAYSSTELPAYGGSGIIATAGWNDHPHRNSYQGDGRTGQGGQPAFDYGEAARRWGEGMMSGVKAVTDYGYNRYYGGNSNHTQSSSSPGSSGATPPAHSVMRSNPNTLFSRSAPHSVSPYMSKSPDGAGENRPYTSAYTAGSGRGPVNSQRPSTNVPSSVVILDLCATMAAFELSRGVPAAVHMPRARSPTGRPGLASGLAHVSHFRPSKHHSLTLLSINSNGTMILSSSSEGHSFNVFEIRPPTNIGQSSIRTSGLTSTSQSSGNRNASSNQSSNPDLKVWHRYRLNRGLTVARTIAAHWSQDSRFVLVSTSRGTVHVYPVNALGGQPTPSSHLTASIGNAKYLMPLSVTVNAIVRVKAPKLVPTNKAEKHEQSHGDAVEQQQPFIGPPDMLFVPSQVLPHSNRAPHPARAPRSSSAATRTVHLALFYPYLHSILQTNIILSASPKTAPSTASLGTRVTSHAVSGLTQMMRNKGSALPTFESEVLLARQEWQLQWPLAAERGIPEEDVRIDLTKYLLEDKQAQSNKVQQTSAHEAEIATFSLAPGVLPRSIYLAQTVAFHTYPPNIAIGQDSKLNRSFSLGNYSLSNLRRIKVRQEVSHRFGSQSAEVDESTELRSAMHTVLEATSLAGSEGVSHLGVSPNSSSPAFPNGYGKPSNSGRWIPSPSSLSSLPIPIGLSPSTVRQAATKVRKYSSNMRSPRLNAVGTTHSLQGSTLSFEDEDAVMAQLPPEMLEDVEEGVDLGRLRGSLNRSRTSNSPSPAPVPSLSLDTGSSADSHADSGGSLSKDNGQANHDSSPQFAASLMGDEDGRVEGEWDSFKLDGIDDDEDIKSPSTVPVKTKTPSPMLSHAMLPMLAAKSEANVLHKTANKDPQLVPPAIEPQQEAILGSSRTAHVTTDTALPMATVALTAEPARHGEVSLISFSPCAHLDPSESPSSSSPGASSSNEMSASPATASGSAAAKRKKKGKKGK